jgi:hypothetical protein
MKLKISLTIIILITCSKLFSQVPHDELMKFYKFSSESITGNSFKDSTAFYGFNIQIYVDKKKNYIPVITNNNDTLATQLIGLNLLSEYDYKGLMGDQDYTKFIIPVAIIILDTKYNHAIEPYIGISISHMFYASTKEDEKMKIIYLEPLIIAFDKKVYH